MRVFSTLMSWSNENKSCMKVDESWEARVCIIVWEFSQLSFMSRSNENKSCMRVDESWLDIIAGMAKTLINSHHNLNQFKPTNIWSMSASLITFWGFLLLLDLLFKLFSFCFPGLPFCLVLCGSGFFTDDKLWTKNELGVLSSSISLSDWQESLSLAEEGIDAEMVGMVRFSCFSLSFALAFFADLTAGSLREDCTGEGKEK